MHFETFAFSLSNQVCCETRIKPQNCFVISGATCKLKGELLYLKTFNIWIIYSEIWQLSKPSGKFWFIEKNIELEAITSGNFEAIPFHCFGNDELISNFRIRKNLRTVSQIEFAQPASRPRIHIFHQPF